MTGVLLLLLVSVLPTANTIQLDGPVECNVGDDVDLVVRNLSMEDLSNSHVTHYPRKNVRVKPSVDWGMKPYIAFRARKSGTFLIAVTLARNGKLEYTETEIKVGDGGEEEDDDPPIPTPPKGMRRLVIVEESELRTPQHAAVMLKLRMNQYLVSENHKFLVVDQDQVSATEGAKQLRAPYLKAAEGESLPVLFVADDETNKIIAKISMPDTEEAVIKFLKKHGG